MNNITAVIRLSDRLLVVGAYCDSSDDQMWPNVAVFYDNGDLQHVESAHPVKFTNLPELVLTCVGWALSTQTLRDKGYQVLATSFATAAQVERAVEAVLGGAIECHAASAAVH